MMCALPPQAALYPKHRQGLHAPVLLMRLPLKEDAFRLPDTSDVLPLAGPTPS